MRTGTRWGLIVLAAALVTGTHLPAQAQDAAAMRKARQLRANAAYQEMKGNKAEAAKLYEESLTLVPDPAIETKVRVLQGAAEAASKPIVTQEAAAPPVTPATPPAAPATPPVEPTATPVAPTAPPVAEIMPETPREKAPELAPAFAATGPDTVQRKINDQCEDLFEAGLEITGLKGAIPPTSLEAAYLAEFLPPADGVRAQEGRKFGDEYTGWEDAGPYVLKTGYAQDGVPVTIRLVCPETPAMKESADGIANTVKRRIVTFVVHSSDSVGYNESVEWTEDRDAGTLTWTPRRVEGAGRVIGPTSVGVYVHYVVERKIHGSTFGNLAGGQHRVAWVLIGNPGAPVLVDGLLYTIVGDGQPATRRPVWDPDAGRRATLEPGQIATLSAEDIKERRLQMSRNFHRVARLEEQGAATFVVIDGTRSAAYDDISYFQFSPDGSSFRFVGTVGPWRIPVVNGREGLPFLDIDDFRTTTDGRRHAFVGSSGPRKQTHTVVVDGKPVKTYEGGGVQYLTFSPDGARFAYMREESDGQKRVILDGEEGTAFPNIVYASLRFNTKGNRFVYIAEKDGRRMGILDGKQLEYPLANDPIAISEDGLHVAYAAKVEGGETVIVDGTPGTVYPSLWSAPVFSPDGKRVAYVARHGDEPKAVAVIDGKEGRTAINYFGVSTPVFSPDSRRVAYSVQVSETEQAVIVDGDEKARVLKARQLVFSPDGKRLAWFEKRDKETVAVVDGESGLASRDMYTDDPVFFTPDSRHFFYFARKGDKAVLLMDHKEILEADSIAPLLDFNVPGKARYTYLQGTGLYMGEVDLP